MTKVATLFFAAAFGRNGSILPAVGAFTTFPATDTKRKGRRKLHIGMTMSSFSTSSSSSSSSSSLHRFYILRHGETDCNASGIIQGSSDISRLTDRGKKQAALIGSSALCPSTGMPPVDSLFVSPLTRARETLSILRTTAPDGMLPPNGSEMMLTDLREIDLYDWEGRCKIDLKTNDPEAFRAWKVGDSDGFVVSGRKPIMETWERAEVVWDGIRRSVSAEVSNAHMGRQARTTLLVCHGTLGQALLSTAFGLSADVFRKNEFPNCGMAEILWHAGEDVARSWRWHHPEPTEHCCLREQILGEGVANF